MMRRRLAAEASHRRALARCSHNIFCATIFCRAAQVSHVKMDPLQRAQVARLDLSSFKCAIVLCDEVGGGAICGRRVFRPSNGMPAAVLAPPRSL